MIEHKPRTRQEFWCSECDSVKVDSEKPETGRFFIVFGHAFDQATKEYDGEYTGVMYSVCFNCRPVQ